MKNWSLQTKIIGILSIFVASNVVAMTVGLMKLSAANHTMDEMAHRLFKRGEILESLKYNQAVMAVTTRDYLIETQSDERKVSYEKIVAAKKEQEAGIEEFLKIASTEEKAMAMDYRDHFKNWFKGTEEALELRNAGKPSDAWEELNTDVAPHRKRMNDGLDKITKINDDETEATIVDAKADFEMATKELLAISIFALIIGGLLATVVLRRLNKTIQGVVDSLQGNSDQVASASAQIASSSEELSQASTEQASSLEETASSLEEISAMIVKASENAVTTATKSAESQAKAEEGHHAVDQMLISMTDISRSNEAIMNQINASNQQMTEIVRVIQDIGNKTKVINEIVFQTKLLSFNASVEAARAGDHGKGFAVVAEEVGNLAQMSGNAAMEITEMLSGSIGKVEQIVNDTKSKVQTLTEQGKQKIESGVGVAHQCSLILKEIVQNVSRVSNLAQEISQGSKEQAQGVGEINKAMNQLDAVTQQNAATSEEAASAAEQLSAQAEALKDTVAELIKTVYGGVGVAASPAVPRTPTGRPAKVVQIRNAHKPAPLVQHQAKLKMAVGDSRVPSRDDDGFTDI